MIYTVIGAEGEPHPGPLTIEDANALVAREHHAGRPAYIVDDLGLPV